LYLGRCQRSFKFNNNVDVAVLYYERLASNIRSANTANMVNHTFSHYAVCTV